MKRAQAYATLHRKFLKDHKPQVYQQMQAAGTLENHVRQVGRSASEMFDQVSTQMVQSPNLPADPQERNQRIEAIPLIAEDSSCRSSISPVAATNEQIEARGARNHRITRGRQDLLGPITPLVSPDGHFSAETSSAGAR